MYLAELLQAKGKMPWDGPKSNLKFQIPIFSGYRAPGKKTYMYSSLMIKNSL